ncbi:MAG: 50S ribosomal protein L3 N(5)-glutamine methyltransferase, partial [Gammaproteobacteria bacterium]|nr:50S ribosomal protein L3 N(5)-glutamine methyltransferase [Gammaproteobacteria bacterium]
MPVATLLRRATRALQRARLHYGHGTDNARDDAAALVWHALRLPDRPGAARLRRGASSGQQARLRALLERRIVGRVPVVYLTHR